MFLRLAVFLCACTSVHPAAEPVVRETIEHVGAAPTTPASPPVATPTPASLYAGCKQRVEGPEEGGECVTDADCTKTGCSQEVCVATSRAGDFVTTCEVLPCFRALDTCGCHDGVCSWTLVEQLPGPAPARLPPKTP